MTSGRVPRAGCGTPEPGSLGFRSSAVTEEGCGGRIDGARESLAQVSPDTRGMSIGTRRELENQ